MSTENYLNINVYVENGVLYARFDILILIESTLHDAQCFLEKIISLSDLSSVAERFANGPTNGGSTDKLVMDSKYITQHLLQITPEKQDNSFKGESTISSVLINVAPDTTLNCNHLSITYRISNTPHVLLNWLAFFSIYINHIMRERLFMHMQFDDHSSFENITGVSSIHDLYRGVPCLIPDNKVLLFMKQMVALKPHFASNPDAFNDLEKICQNYERYHNSGHFKPLLECLFELARSQLVYSEHVKKFSSLNDTQAKEAHFLILTLAHEETAKKLECLFMLETLNSSAKINLIIPCMGKIAHDKGEYDMAYIELQLIYFAEFYLFPNGTMGIINLNKNPSYRQYYAEGQRYFSIFSSEFNHLAKVLNLELKPGCDHHKDNQILFTPACSLELANLGVHLNGNYSKELFNVYKSWTFFTRLQKAGNTVFSSLSNELLDAIIIETNPSYKGMYHNKLYPGFFQAVHLGRERGIQEHREKMGATVQCPDASLR